MNCFNRASCVSLAFAVALVAIVAGCGREAVKVYRAAKEPPLAPQPQAMPAGHPPVNIPKPQISWTLPDGWKETGAGRMSFASFTISGKDGKQAEVAITPLGNLADQEVSIVNLWRKEVGGLPAISAEEVQKQLQPVEIAGAPGKMFEISGKADNTNAPRRIVTAMVHRADGSWFYKLAGDAEVVEAQKPAFVAFLKSIKISESPVGEAAAASTATDTASATPSKWKTPADWKAVPPGPMQDAKFAVPEKNGAKADVTVSVFQNSTGGTLANVNRWRGQIGLPQITESELAKLVTPLDEKMPDAVLVDMNGTDTRTGQPARLIGAIVPRNGQWTFYKLFGHPDAVAPQKDAFLSFAKAQP